MADGSITPGVGYTIKDSVDADADEAPKKAQRERLLEAVLRAGVAFWQDADGTAYATVPASGSMGQQRYRVRSRRFALVVRDFYGRAHQRADYPRQRLRYRAGRNASRPGSHRASRYGV